MLDLWPASNASLFNDCDIWTILEVYLKIGWVARLSVLHTHRYIVKITDAGIEGIEDIGGIPSIHLGGIGIVSMPDTLALACWVQLLTVLLGKELFTALCICFYILTRPNTSVTTVNHDYYNSTNEIKPRMPQYFAFRAYLRLPNAMFTINLMWRNIIPYELNRPRCLIIRGCNGTSIVLG